MPAPQPMTKLSSAEEMDEFVRWLKTHTGVGHVANRALIEAFRRAEAEGGYVVCRVAP